MLFTEGEFDGNGVVDVWDEDAVFANWLIDLTDTWTLADLDGDLDVDDDDLATLAGNIGMSTPTRADGDLDGDGDIDAADMDLAFAQYGIDFAAVS